MATMLYSVLVISLLFSSRAVVADKTSCPVAGSRERKESTIIPSKKERVEASFFEEARAAEGVYKYLTDHYFLKKKMLMYYSMTRRQPIYLERNTVLSGIKGFWGRVLGYHHKLRHILSKSDRMMLRYLDDITLEDLNYAVYDKKFNYTDDIVTLKKYIKTMNFTHFPMESFRIVFTFLDNPFFSDYQLFSENNRETKQNQLSGIHWYPGKAPKSVSLLNIFENYFEVTTQKRAFLSKEYFESYFSSIYDVWEDPLRYYGLNRLVEDDYHLNIYSIDSILKLWEARHPEPKEDESREL